MSFTKPQYSESYECFFFFIKVTLRHHKPNNQSYLVYFTDLVFNHERLEYKTDFIQKQLITDWLLTPIGQLGELFKNM